MMTGALIKGVYEERGYENAESFNLLATVHERSSFDMTNIYSKTLSKP